MSTRITTLFTIVTLLFTSNTILAQDGGTDYSEDDITQFVSINKETLPIQMAAQQKMMTVVQESGMDMTKFQTMAMAAQKGDQTLGGASDEEKAQFMALGEKLNALQQDLGTKMQEAVTASGMEPMKFQQMAMTYQQDASFRSKIDGLMGIEGDEDEEAEEGE